MQKVHSSQQDGWLFREVDFAGRGCRMFWTRCVERLVRSGHVPAAVILLFCGTCDTALAQRTLPIPACPGRGVIAPTGEESPFLVRQYGCSLSSTDIIAENAEEDPAPLFLLPEQFHAYEGMTGEYIYTGEVFTNTRGGLSTHDAIRYRGNLDLVLNVDTAAMDMWKGGRFFIYGNTFHGQTLTPDFVGDFQFYSNIEGAPRPDAAFQMSEYWYEHSFADGNILVKVGKQDANADFAYVDLGGDFINSSFGLIPTVLLPTWPNPGMGAAVFVDLTDLIHVKTGVYDGSPTFGVETGGRSGFESLGDYGAMVLNEWSLTPQLGPDGSLPGTYKVGMWYHSQDLEDLYSPGLMQGHNYGFYLGVDQLLWNEPGSDEDPQGLGAFIQYGWAPRDRNELWQYAGTGLTYRGPISNRDADVVGVGIAAAEFHDASLDWERAIELFYKAQVNDWAILQPDMQYIANPSGSGRDALVVGIRTELAF